MEPRKTKTPVQSRGEGRTPPPRQRERKRRFQIVKLEERIAPQHTGSYNHGCISAKCFTRTPGHCP
jgi:hypothetical protein